METTKKTSTTKAALLVLAALSMLLSGLFIATASSSDAQATCPAGFTLSADGANCSQPSATTTLDLGNTCATGFLSPDGANCWIAATSMDQAGTIECPAGFSLADDVCSQSAGATTVAASCEAGASGTPATGCYTTVAQTLGAASCDTGTVSGSSCLYTDDPFELEECVAVPTWSMGDSDDDCVTTYAYDLIADECEEGGVQGDDGVAPLTWDDEDLCYVQEDVTNSGVLGCDPGWILQGGECQTWDDEDYNEGELSCPAGSVIDGSGVTCRAVAGSAATAYECVGGSAGATLTVTAATPPVATCDWSTGFNLGTAGDVLYMCAAGTPAVVGTAVLCDLGAATSGATTGPACLNGGVLSADEASCVVPATVAVAAPVPAFTG